MNIISKITLTDVGAAFTVHQPVGMKTDIRSRSSFGLSLSLGGRIVYTQNGESLVSDTNRAIIHPQGSSYSFVCEREGDFIVINFYATDFFTDKFLSYEISSPERLVERYYDLREVCFIGDRVRALSIMYEILAIISDEESGAKSTVLAPAMRYLWSNYTSPELSNEKLAARAHISESYFRRLFLKTYSVTPRQYIINARIRLAKQLLSERRLSVSEVAEKCGFGAVYHFCRTFKESTGYTPHSYSEKFGISKI